jgi:cell division protein FtsN
MKELMKALGKQAQLRLEGFSVAVTISDVKQAYGNTRYYVTPVNGTGEAWVDESRISNIQGVN